MNTQFYKWSLMTLSLLMAIGLAGRSLATAAKAKQSGPVASNDFFNPWVGAWLWRHGQNPYAVALAGEVREQTVHRDGSPLLVNYPITTCMLLAGFTLVSWKTANLAWSLVTLLSLPFTALLLPRLNGFTSDELRYWFLVAMVFCLTPFRAGVLVENPAVACTALCFAAIYLASMRMDAAAGIVLMISIGLKPHLGIWILLFYIVRRRWRLVLSSVTVGAAMVALAAVRVPLSPAHLLVSYSENVRGVLIADSSIAFSNGNPAGLLNLQVVLYPLIGRFATPLIYFMFILGLAIWLWSVQDAKSCPEPLAIGCILALSFVPLYHRIYDVGLLSLILCWSLSRSDKALQHLRHATSILFALFLIPEHFLSFAAQRFGPTAVRSALWNFIVAPHAMWTIVLLNIVLLSTLVVMKRSTAAARLEILSMSQARQCA